jgi:predicted transcriptional regulator/KaiC/GvpD/RAD55 family RecA-like ATPase
VVLLAKRRTRYEIYADLLDCVARKGACKLTRASYGANLPVDRTKKTLAFLASRGFVSEDTAGDSKVYRITKRGWEYLETFKQMRKLFAALDEGALPSPPMPPHVAPGPPGRLQAKLSLETEEPKIGEDLDLAIEVSNVGGGPIVLTKVEDVIPPSFEVVAKPDSFSFEGKGFDMNRKRLDLKATEKIALTLKPFDVGEFVMKPRIVYEDVGGTQMLCNVAPTTLKVAEVIAGHVSTGVKSLDDLLLGGIPTNYAVILTAFSCDERDLLVRRFVEAGVRDRKTSFYFTVEPGSMKALAEEFQANMHLFICNPQADKIVKDLPNVFRLGGVENLTDLNIALTAAYRKLGPPKGEERRACVEILSDVLLQHHAVQTRRWLTGLLPELKSKGFTTLAVMNPLMHSPEEVQAVLGLFDGEINIYEKASKKGMRKYLRIKRMYNQRYRESEMPLIKSRL